MQELIQYAKDRNAETLAWIAEDPENRWAGLMPEDASYFESLGVSTVAEYELAMDKATYSDMFKSVHGFRPRHDTSDWTDDQWRQEIDSLSAKMEEQMAEKERADQEAITKFKVRIADLMNVGAMDRQTAIRWMIQSADIHDYHLHHGADFVAFCMGLPYSIQHDADFAAACKDLQQQADEAE